MIEEAYWAVAQTVPRMEHLVRRDIEKTNHGAFIPTYAKHWRVDDREYSKEYPLLIGYVFFLTKPDEWAGIPDIHGVYKVLSSRVLPDEMKRLMVGHASGEHDKIGERKFTRYYRPPTKKAVRYRRRRPRPGKRLRSVNNPQSPQYARPEQISHVPV